MEQPPQPAGRHVGSAPVRHRIGTSLRGLIYRCSEIYRRAIAPPKRNAGTFMGTGFD